MSELRLPYARLAPEALAKLKDLEHFLTNGTTLDRTLLELVRLRASQVNGCEYCISVHAGDLRKLNTPEPRIAALSDWRTSDLYTPREKAALAWTESVTDIQQGHAPDALFNELRNFFTDAETVHLTFVISIINAWNRLAISLGAHSSRSSSGAS